MPTQTKTNRHCEAEGCGNLVFSFGHPAIDAGSGNFHCAIKKLLLIEN